MEPMSIERKAELRKLSHLQGARWNLKKTISMLHEAGMEAEAYELQIFLETHFGKRVSYDETSHYK